MDTSRSRTPKPTPVLVQASLDRLGRRLARARKLREMTQEDLAHLSDVSLSTLRSLEAGLVHDGRLRLAKMQSRGDRPALPAREFVAMRLAHMAGLSVAEVELHTFGAHQVLLVERFDRAGDPRQPKRRLYASAHTVLRLAPQVVRGDPQRSYLHLGDRLRVWARDHEDLPGQLQEVWRRMAFNALVGNVDDHPLSRRSMAEWRTGRCCRWPQGWMGRHAPASSSCWRRPFIWGWRLTWRGPGCWRRRSWWLATGRRCSEKEAAWPVMDDLALLDALVAEARVAFAYGEWLAETANRKGTE